MCITKLSEAVFIVPGLDVPNQDGTELDAPAPNITVQRGSRRHNRHAASAAPATHLDVAGAVGSEGGCDKCSSVGAVIYKPYLQQLYIKLTRQMPSYGLSHAKQGCMGSCRVAFPFIHW